MLTFAVGTTQLKLAVLIIVNLKLNMASLSTLLILSAVSDVCLPTKRSPHPRDCSEIQSTCPGEGLVSGEYMIEPDHYPSPFLVYCDFDTEGEAWTVRYLTIQSSKRRNFTT